MSRARRGCLVGLASFGVLFAWACIREEEHILTPHPRGMVLRVEAPRVYTPFNNRIRVRPADGGEPALVIEVAAFGGRRPRTIHVTYPEGAVRQLESGSRVEPAPPLDFDGDGTPDEILCGRDDGYGWVKVISGATGSTLFADDDPLEYESHERAFSLGDLDGDGYGELALVHPRMDRSAYDLFELHMFMKVKSWVTVVSGSELAKR